jgi:hypothetical protein
VAHAYNLLYLFPCNLADIYNKQVMRKNEKGDNFWYPHTGPPIAPSYNATFIHGTAEQV